jgi:hypothetical protein
MGQFTCREAEHRLGPCRGGAGAGVVGLEIGIRCGECGAALRLKQATSRAGRNSLHADRRSTCRRRRHRLNRA